MRDLFCQLYGSLRIRTPEYPELMQCLYIWFKKKAVHNLLLPDKILIKQANRFMKELGISSVGFESYNGWFQIEKRHDLKAHKICGESANKIVNEIC